jgi:hypothetical protein
MSWNNKEEIHCHSKAKEQYIFNKTEIPGNIFSSCPTEDSFSEYVK